MERVAVSVRVPALNDSFEFIVPDSMAVKEVTKLMLDILESEYGVPGNPADTVLIDYSDGRALRGECSFRQLGISDGDRLLMI